MTVRRILPAIGLSLLLTLSLVGCSLLPGVPAPTPEPSSTVEVDFEAMERRMAQALPEASGDVEIYRTTGLDESTFGTGWGVHDEVRLVRVLNDYVSVGWADSSLGPGYMVLFELVLMESTLAADAVMNDLAASTKEPYTIESTGPDIAEYQYSPAQPSGRWPIGTVEQERRMTWPTGERASGWIAWGASGPFAFVVSAAAVPEEVSIAAMESFVDEHAAGFLERIEELRAEL